MLVYQGVVGSDSRLAGSARLDRNLQDGTWWLKPLSKWVITPVINGLSKVNTLITGVITHVLSGMSHQV